MIPLVVLSLILVSAFSVRADEDAVRAQKIVNRAVGAIGGQKALETKKVVTIKETGTYYGIGDGLPYEGEFKIQFPGNYRMEILNIFTIVVNDKMGWTSSMGETTELDEDQLKERQKLIHTSYIVSLIPIAKPGKTYRLSLTGEEKVDGETCDGVKVESDKHRTVKLLFSRKTGLLRKSEATVRSDELDKDVVETQIFKDYRDVDGAKIAFQTEVKRDGTVFIESQATDVSFPKEADPKWFTKP
jgi:outer membrane lipoprotein-sorting protein